MNKNQEEFDARVFEGNDAIDSLPDDERNLVLAAWEARKNAYMPYSKFAVGAAGLISNGQIFIGSNQELANYDGSCAERVVLDSIGAAGYKDQVRKLAIVGAPASVTLDGDRPTEPEEPVVPCGRCRQVIKEVEVLSKEPIVIILASRNKIRRVGLDILLPFAFGPASLGITPGKTK